MWLLKQFADVAQSPSFKSAVSEKSMNKFPSRRGHHRRPQRGADVQAVTAGAAVEDHGFGTFPERRTSSLPSDDRPSAIDKCSVTTVGGSKHVIAVLVVPDTLALGIPFIQQVFGAPPPALVDVASGADSPYSVVLCGERERYILSAGADFGELASLESLAAADTVIVPGVDAPLATRSDYLLSSLRTAESAGARMVSFCGGSFILGYAGVLDRRRATTHWQLASEFRQAFPHVRLQAEHLYVDDGPVHTAGGMFAATDLSLHLMAEDFGQSYANDLEGVLVCGPQRRGGQAQFIKRASRADAYSEMDELLSWMRENVSESFTLAQLAHQSHVSERTLVRKFRLATGMSVFDWLTTERISQARALLESTNYRIGEIAVMVGYRSPESFRRNFEKIAGTTAGAYRSAFRTAPLPATRGA
jgi:AraC family transcriptional regulator, transcriptional activator FtrA